MSVQLRYSVPAAQKIKLKVRERMIVSADPLMLCTFIKSSSTWVESDVLNSFDSSFTWFMNTFTHISLISQHQFYFLCTSPWREHILSGTLNRVPSFPFEPISLIRFCVYFCEKLIMHCSLSTMIVREAVISRSFYILKKIEGRNVMLAFPYLYDMESYVTVIYPFWIIHWYSFPSEIMWESSLWTPQ